MLTAVEALNRLAGAMGPIVLATLWQSALLATVVALVAAVLRRASPVLRYWLWQILAIKLLLMPFWTSALKIDWPIAPALGPSTMHESKNLADSELATAAEGTATAQALNHASDPRATSEVTSSLGALTWSAWLLLVWAAILVMQLMQLVYQGRRLGKLFRSAVAAENDVVSLVQQIGRSLSLKGIPSVLLTTESCSPFVQG